MNQANAPTQSSMSAEQLVQSLRSQAGKPNDVFELTGALVEGDVDLRSLSFQPKVVFRSCTFRGLFDAGEATFYKSLTLVGCRFERCLHFFGTRVGGQLLLEDATIDGVPDDGASFEQMRVSGNFSAAGVRADGRLNFRGASIDGQMELSGAQIGGDLSLQNARINGNLFLRSRNGQRATIEGNAWLFGVQVGDLVELSGAVIGGDLLMEDSMLKGGLFCRPQDGERTELRGQVWVTGARVAGTVDLGGAKIGGDVLGESADINGGFFCRPQDGFRTEIGGRLWLSAVKVGSQVSLAGASIGGNVVLQHAELDGGVALRSQDNFRSEVNGDLWMVGAKISGGVDLTSAHVKGNVNLQNARLDDLVFRGESETPLAVDGSLDLEAARIGRLEMDGRATGDRSVKLPLAKVTHLNVLESIPSSVELEGFTFQQLTLPGDRFLDWLAASSTFQSSTYVYLENWLRNHGDHANANRVYLAMRRRDRWQGRKGLFRRVGDWFLDKSVGYGIHWYRPLVFYFVPILILTVILFSSPLSVQCDVPVLSGPPAIASVEPKPGEWGPTDAVATALRINLPMFALIVDDDWEPSSNKIECCGQTIGVTYAAYALVVSLLSWIAVPLFVIGLSGVLKKET